MTVAGKSKPFEGVGNEVNKDCDLNSWTIHQKIVYLMKEKNQPY